MGTIAADPHDHPSWCDPAACTGTSHQSRTHAVTGEHQSIDVHLNLAGRRPEPLVLVEQRFDPDTAAWLELEDNDPAEMLILPLAEARALWSALGAALADAEPAVPLREDPESGAPLPPGIEGWAPGLDDEAIATTAPR